MNNNEFYKLLKAGKTEEEILKILNDQLHDAQNQLAAEKKEEEERLAKAAAAEQEKKEKAEKLESSRSTLAAAFTDYLLLLGVKDQKAVANTVATILDGLKIYEDLYDIVEVKASPSELTASASADNLSLDESEKLIDKLISFVDRLYF